MSSAETHNWYVLTSKPREEQRAFDNLCQQGYDCFLPKISKLKKRNQVKTVSLEPLFPNYLFIHLDKDTANFNAIRSTRGVGSFVKFGITPAMIDSLVVNKIKMDLEREDTEKTVAELENYKPGEKVEITTGPFKGLDAVYKNKDGLERSILLIKMLGQQNEIKIENQAIEKAS